MTDDYQRRYLEYRKRKAEMAKVVRAAEEMKGGDGMTVIGSYEEKLIRCPLCEGIGQIYWVNRAVGEEFVPRRKGCLTLDEVALAKVDRLVFGRCHGCLGRGLVCTESLREASP